MKRLLLDRFVVRHPGQSAPTQEAYDLLWSAWKSLGRQEKYLEDPAPPQVLWRGMEEAEYANTLGAGKPLQSRGDYSFSVEGTQFSDDPGTAEDYVNFGRSDPRQTGSPNYLVAVRGEVGTQKPDGYYESHRPVPPGEVLGVWRMGVEDGAVVAERVDGRALTANGATPAPGYYLSLPGKKRGVKMANNPPLTPNTAADLDRVFDDSFDTVEKRFPDFGTAELHRDDAASSDNGAGSERQYAYCKEGDPIIIAFAEKAYRAPVSRLRGLMRHEFGHALEYRYGVKELERRLGVKLPAEIERRADAIAEAVWGEPIVYDEQFVQCVAADGTRPRPAHLPDEKAKLKANPNTGHPATAQQLYEAVADRWLAGDLRHPREIVGERPSSHPERWVWDVLDRSMDSQQFPCEVQPLLARVAHSCHLDYYEPTLRPEQVRRLLGREPKANPAYRDQLLEEETHLSSLPSSTRDELLRRVRELDALEERAMEAYERGDFALAERIEGEYAVRAEDLEGVASELMEGWSQEDLEEEPDEGDSLTVQLAALYEEYLGDRDHPASRFGGDWSPPSSPFPVRSAEDMLAYLSMHTIEDSTRRRIENPDPSLLIDAARDAYERRADLLRRRWGRSTGGSGTSDVG